MVNGHTNLLLLSLALLSVVLLLCSSCGDSPPPPETEAVETQHVHTPVPVPEIPASCESNGQTEGMRCQSCGVYTVIPQMIEKLGHTCRYGICERCLQPIRYGLVAPDTGIWSGGYYKDEFGDLTDTRVVFTEIIKGSFSNSATNGSRLSVVLYSEENCIRIALYEYDTLPLSGTYQTYEIHIKHGEEKEVMYASIDNKTILLDHSNFTKIKDILCKGEDIQFVIYEDRGTTTYKFTVSASNYYSKCSYVFSSINHPYWDQESVEKNNFLTLAQKVPDLSLFSASTMLEIHDYIDSQINIHAIDSASEGISLDADTLGQIVFQEASDNFYISVEQAKLIFGFVELYYDTVRIAAEYDD